MSVTTAGSGANRAKVALGEVLTLVNGRAYKQEELLDEGTPVIRIQNLNGGDRWYYSNLNLPADKYCEEGDLLFAWSATFGPYFWSGPKSIYHYHIWKVVPSAHLDKRFAYYLLQSITDRVKAAGRGISMIHMTKGGMEAWEVELPPLDEQKRIAAILDKADQLRQKRRQAIALLESLTQSIFMEMFGKGEGGDTIGRLLAIGHLVLHKDGNHGSNYPRADEFGETGVPFLSARSIADDGRLIEGQVQYLNEKKAYQLKIGWIQDGDVLLSHNASVGKVGIYRGEFGKALIGTSLTAFRTNPEKIVPEFLYASLRGAFFQSQLTKSMSQTTRNQVPITAQKDLRLLVPPIETQKDFMRRLTQIIDERNNLSRGTIALDDLFSSLQHRAFSGQL